MLFTQTLHGFIPEARKPASGFGVTKRALGHAEFRHDDLGGQLRDDGGCCLLAHGGTMPSNLARVKPTESRLPQIIWQSTKPGMDSDEKPFSDIAERLRWHRGLEGLDQKEYAEKAGLKRAQLSNWETGDYRLSLDGARALRRTYGLSLDFIYEGIDDALPMTLRAAWRERPSVKASR
jgi:DNA-binding XRE family transcriptional regulator